MSHLFCLTLLMVTFGGLASAQEPISLGTVTPPRSAASAAAPASPASLMDLQDKLTTLESSLQAQTQQIEDLQKTVQTLEQKLAQPPEAPAPTENETATAPDNTPDVSPENDAAESSDEISPAFGQAKPSQPLESTADADPYQTGIDALKQGQYAKARDHFTTFITNNPDDKLVPNAYYWMGEAYYAEGNYRKSGETFLKSFQDYPDSPKAPDSLLKLGLSLQSAKQNKQACQSFDELLRRYPKANPTIIQRAKRAKASCA